MHWITYIKGVLIVTLCFTLKGDGKSIKELLDHDVQKHLEPSIQVALVNGQYKFVAFSQLALWVEAYGW